MSTLEHTSTNITPAPMPTALVSDVETAIVGHVPSTSLNKGFSLTIPFIKIPFIEFFSITYHPSPVRYA